MSEPKESNNKRKKKKPKKKHRRPYFQALPQNLTSTKRGKKLLRRSSNLEELTLNLQKRRLHLQNPEPTRLEVYPQASQWAASSPNSPPSARTILVAMSMKTWMSSNSPKIQPGKIHFFPQTILALTKADLTKVFQIPMPLIIMSMWKRPRKWERSFDIKFCSINIYFLNKSFNSR